MPQIKVSDIITNVTLNTINGILHFLSSFSNERIYIVAAGAGGGGSVAIGSTSTSKEKIFIVLKLR
jgi:hypothetical protein